MNNSKNSGSYNSDDNNNKKRYNKGHVSIKYGGRCKVVDKLYSIYIYFII